MTRHDPRPAKVPRLLTSQDTQWQRYSICPDEDPNLFFPAGNGGVFLLQIEEAKAVCRRCPVMAACAAWALTTGQETGVWGGMSEDERRSMKRHAARNRAPAAA
jgi:WhiB family redox-sensing transcriptional regulator